MSSREKVESAGPVSRSINQDMISTQKHLIHGIIAVLIATIIGEFISTTESSNIPAFLVTIIGFFTSWGLSIMLGMLMLWAAIEILKRGVGWFWHHYLQPPLEQYGQILKDEVERSTRELSDGIEGKMHHLSEELDKFQNDANHLLKDNLLSSVVSRSEPEYLESKIDFIHGKTYGSHCSKQEGLFGAMRSRLYPYLDPNKPHRSQHNQHVVICEKDGRVVCEETTQFEVHTVCFDSGYDIPEKAPEEVLYELKFKSAGCYVDLEDMILQISVNGEVEASLQDLLEVRDDTEDLAEKYYSNDEDKMTVTHIGSGFLNFAFNLKITIAKKKKIKVKIYEMSYLDDEDNFYVVKREEPTYGSTISVTLPPNWSIYSFTVPDEVQWGRPNSLPQSQSVRVADTNEWVMPGIVLSCIWSRG